MRYWHSFAIAAFAFSVLDIFIAESLSAALPALIKDALLIAGLFMVSRHLINRHIKQLKQEIKAPFQGDTLTILIIGCKKVVNQAGAWPESSTPLSHAVKKF
jgi:hypothetical protein